MLLGKGTCSLHVTVGMEPQHSDWVQAGHQVMTLQIWQISLKILGYIITLLLLSLLFISLEQVVVQKTRFCVSLVNFCKLILLYTSFYSVFCKCIFNL